MTRAGAQSARLRVSLERLAEEAGRLRLELTDDPEAAAQRDRLVELVRGSLVPRLTHPQAPLMVVFFGPTGAGKSTILNSLAGRVVSPASALRPTTSRPVVWCSRPEPYEALDAVIVTEDHPMLTETTLVDTPDIDSVLIHHRKLTDRILLRADAAVFVTTPQRYADAAAWSVLDRVAARLPVVVVVNRVSRHSKGALADFTRMARRAGLEAVSRLYDLLVVAEQHQPEPGRLHPEAVAHLAEVIGALGSYRHKVLAERMNGSVAEVTALARRLAALVRTEADHARRLRHLAEAVHRRHAAAFRERFRTPPADRPDGTDDFLVQYAAWRILRAAREVADAWGEDPVGRRLIDDGMRRPPSGSEDVLRDVVRSVDDPVDRLGSMIEAQAERFLRRIGDALDPSEVADLLEARATAVESDVPHARPA